MKNLDKINISERLDETIATSMKSVKTIKRNRIAKKCSAISVFTLVLLGGFCMACYSNPVWASQLPIIGSIFEQVQGGNTFSEKAEVAVATAEDNGINIDVNEVYFDGYNAYISFDFISATPLGEIVKYRNVSIDGIETLNSAVYISGTALVTCSGGNNYSAEISNVIGKQVGDNQFIGMICVNFADLNSQPLIDDFNISVDINSIMADIVGFESQDSIMPYMIIDGNWKLDFAVSTGKNQLKEYNVNLTNDSSDYGVRRIVKTDEMIIINPYQYGYDNDGYMTEEYFNELFSTEIKDRAENPENYEKPAPSFNEGIRTATSDIYMTLWCVDAEGNGFNPSQKLLTSKGNSRYLLTENKDIRQIYVYFQEKDNFQKYCEALRATSDVKMRAASIAEFSITLD